MVQRVKLPPRKLKLITPEGRRTIIVRRGPFRMVPNMSLSPILFATLGTFIIDTFEFIDPSSGVSLGDGGRGERIGGGGTYASVGARIWLPPSRVLMVVDRGVDWDQSWQATLDSLASTAAKRKVTGHSMWKYRTRSKHTDTGTGEEGSDLTTKALNAYTGQTRKFKYLTPRQRLNPNDLVLRKGGLPPAWIHCICTPNRIPDIARQIQILSPWTRICWEPLDDSATPANLEETLSVMRHVHVFSPNHQEAASFLGVQLSVEEKVVDEVTVEEAQRVRGVHLEKLAREFRRRYVAARDASGYTARSLPPPLIVIRSGAAGSVALSPDGQYTTSVPSYHLLTGTQDAVKDVTGGGNSFLGGFTAYLAQQRDLNEQALKQALNQALVHGSVSASFAIEQLGLPILKINDDGQETWNGQTAEHRANAFHHH